MEPPWSSPSAPEPLLLLEDDAPDPGCLGPLAPASPAPESPSESSCALERLLEAFSCCDGLGASAGALGPAWEGGPDSGPPLRDSKEGQRRQSAQECRSAAHDAAGHGVEEELLLPIPGRRGVASAALAQKQLLAAGLSPSSSRPRPSAASPSPPQDPVPGAAAAAVDPVPPPPGQPPQSCLQSEAELAGPAPPAPSGASLSLSPNQLHGPCGAGATEHQRLPSASTAAAPRPTLPPPGNPIPVALADAGDKASWSGTNSAGLPPPHPAPLAPSVASSQRVAALNPGPHAVKLLEIPVSAPYKRTVWSRAVAHNPPFQQERQGCLLQAGQGTAGASTHPLCANMMASDGSNRGRALHGEMRLLDVSLSSSRTHSAGSDGAVSLPREPEAAAPAGLGLQLPPPAGSLPESKACSCATADPSTRAVLPRGAPAMGPQSKEQMLMWIKDVVQEAMRSLHVSTAQPAVRTEASASSRVPCKHKDSPESMNMPCSGFLARTSNCSAGHPATFNWGNALADDVSFSKREDYAPRTPVKEETSAARGGALEGFALEAGSCGNVTRNNDSRNTPHKVDSTVVCMLSACSQPWAGGHPFDQDHLLQQIAGPGLSAGTCPRVANLDSGEPLTSDGQASSRMHERREIESTMPVRRAGVRSRLRPPLPSAHEHADLARAEARRDRGRAASQEVEGSENVQLSAATNEADKSAERCQRSTQDKGKRMIHLLEEEKAAAKNEGERRRRSKIMSAYKRLRIELQYEGEVHGMLAEAASVIKCQQERMKELQQKIACGLS